MFFNELLTYELMYKQRNSDDVEHEQIEYVLSILF